MGRFYRQRVRPQLKRVARSIGIRESRARKPKSLPNDFDDQTRRIFEQVNEFTMTSPERIQALINAVRYVHANDIEGDFVECGVWRGGSSMAVALTLKELGSEQRNLWLYDTFEGMTAPGEEDIAFDGKSAEKKFLERRLSDDSSDWCRSPLEEVRANLAATQYAAEKIHYIKGKVEDTLPASSPGDRIAILRLDTDWYSSTRHELIHLYPRLVHNGVLIIDDYAHWDGARKAVDEYIAEHRLRLLLNRIDAEARIAVKV